MSPSVLLSELESSPRAACEQRVGLLELRQRTLGSRDVIVGVVDGPVSPGTLSAWAAPAVRRIGGDGDDSCALELDHGAVTALLLGARRDAPLPGLCPECRILIRPALSCRQDSQRTILHATEEEIAAAILDCLEQGASIINLSLGIRGASLGAVRGPMREAIERAQSQGAVLVFAAGNHPSSRGPRVGRSGLAEHALVAVAACDPQGLPAAFSNVGPSLSHSGLLAPGVQVPHLRADGTLGVASGTSLAAPFVTAALALLRSLDPRRSAAEVLAILREVRPPQARRGPVPALLDVSAALGRLSSSPVPSPQKEIFMSTHDPALTATPGAAQPTAIPQSGAAPGGCGCGGSASAVESGAPIYAIGDVTARYPTLGIEKEVAQVVAREGLTGTDSRVLYEVLKKPFNRYLARRICWVLRIEGFDAYLLKPEDEHHGYELLIESICPSSSGQDFDLVIGSRTGVAPPSLCNGAVLPIVTFDQIYSFEEEHFLSLVRGGDKSPAEEATRESDQALLRHILQLADNTGVEDEHRALNYLTVRYARMYQRVGERHKHGFQLGGINVTPSRVTNSRKVVNVIFEFRNRQTDVTEKDYVRVDVTEKYPFLVSPMQQYYDR